MKYVILETKKGFKCPVLFHSWINHNEFKEFGYKIVGAGHVEIYEDLKVIVYDGSKTLGIQANKQDERLIQKFVEIKTRI